MGSDLYDVEVVRVAGRRATLRIEVVHPDAGPAVANAGFALQVLHDLARGDAPLALEVSLDDTMDALWLRRHARGFIAEERVEVERVPTGAGTDSWRGWKGLLHLEVTHVAWIAHLQPGTTQTSRAFAETDHFDAHATIIPTHRLAKGTSRAETSPFARMLTGASALLGRTLDSRGGTELVDEEASIPVPCEILETVSGQSLRGVFPRVIDAPAHPPSAYEPHDVRGPHVDLTRLRSWEGRLVWWQRGDHERADFAHASVGPLFFDRGEAILAPIAEGAWGVTYAGHGFEGRLGLARLRPDARRGERLSLNRLLRGGLPHLVGARRRGREALFELRVAPGSVPDVPLDVANAFYLLMAPLMPNPPAFAEMHVPPALAAAPLTKALHAVAAEDGNLPKLSDLIRIWKNDFIRDVQIVSTPLVKRDLDALSYAEARRLFEGPWPRIELAITAYHEESLIHLDQPIAERSLGLHDWG